MNTLTRRLVRFGTTKAFNKYNVIINATHAGAASAASSSPSSLTRFNNINSSVARSFVVVGSSSLSQTIAGDRMFVNGVARHQQQPQQQPQQRPYHHISNTSSTTCCPLNETSLLSPLSLSSSWTLPCPSLSDGPSTVTNNPPVRKRNFSSDSATTTGDMAVSKKQPSSVLSPTTATVVTDTDTGEKFGMILDTRKLPKLKPSIVQQRLANCKTYIGRERTIRQSPWKLNRICQLAAGLTLEEALTQLKFCPLKNADLVAKVLKRTSNLADIRDSIQVSQLEVAECFVTKSMMLRRIRMMGRGRQGIMHHKYSHIRVVLREIDFPLKIYQQKSLNQKKKWLQHQERADRDGKAAKIKRTEMERLMKQQQEQLEVRKAANRQ